MASLYLPTGLAVKSSGTGSTRNCGQSGKVRGKHVHTLCSVEVGEPIPITGRSTLTTVYGVTKKDVHQSELIIAGTDRDWGR